MLIVPFSNSPSRALSTAINSLRADRDNIDRIWVFDDAERPDGQPFPSQTLIESSSGLRFVTPFDPGRLMVYESSTQRYRPAKAKMILSLDSNLCSLLRQVFVGGSDDPDKLRVVIDLAKHNRIWRAEAQPVPYIRELVLRTKVIDTRDDAQKVVVALLKMQALLPETSEGAGRLLYDDTFLDRVRDRFGVDTFEECAAIIVQEMIDKGDPGLDHDHIATYGALLKMIDIGIRMKASPLDNKLAEIDAFIVGELQAVQPRLFVLARLFFRGTLSRLLKVGPGDANFQRKYLIGSSFDLYLTTIHEKFLGDSEAPEGWLSILCTLDQGLATYAGRFPTRSIASMKDHSFRIAHSWDDVWLKSVLGPQHHAEVIASIDARIPSHQTTHLSTDMIGTIRELEKRLEVDPAHSLLGNAAPKTITAQERT